MPKRNIKPKKFKNKSALFSNLKGFAPIWIVLIIFFLIIIGFFVFLKLNPKEEDQNKAGSLNLQKNENVQEQTKDDPSSIFSKIQEAQKNQPKKVDSDKDGLSDDKEKEVYKTDPNKTDTDQDGLSDWQEIVVYGTDALNPDTDNDGVNDKEEIQNNTNPNGEGKIEPSADNSLIIK